MNGAEDGMMDGSMVVVIMSTIAILLLWLWLSRPSAPDPEVPEEAARSLGENMAGLFVLALIVVAMLVGVVAL